MEKIIRGIKEYFSLPSTLLVALIFSTFLVVSIYIFFAVPDAASYWASAALFIIGTLISYHLSQTAGFDSALSHFREVIVGSISIGLTSIKKLSDTPPEKIASNTKNSLEFIGIAGEKFLRSSMESSDFFRKNKKEHNVRLAGC